MPGQPGVSGVTKDAGTARFVVVSSQSDRGSEGQVVFSVLFHDTQGSDNSEFCPYFTKYVNQSTYVQRHEESEV